MVAVERAGELVAELQPDFRFAEGDALFLFGSDAAVRGFRELA